MSHGVMVAQQILVLSVKVRVLVGQHTKRCPVIFAGLFLYMIFIKVCFMINGLYPFCYQFYQIVIISFASNKFLSAVTKGAL